MMTSVYLKSNDHPKFTKADSDILMFKMKGQEIVKKFKKASLLPWAAGQRINS